MFLFLFSSFIIIIHSGFYSLGMREGGSCFLGVRGYQGRMIQGEVFLSMNHLFEESPIPYMYFHCTIVYLLPPILFLHIRGSNIIIPSTLLPISELVLVEKFQRNASKFAIFYTYENPMLLFLFFISCYFTIFPNECPGLC